MSSLSERDLKLAIGEMENIASTMDIPFSRHRDAGWILRNAAINNQPSIKLDKLIKLAGIIDAHSKGSTNES
jgi:hypothetical protein